MDAILYIFRPRNSAAVFFLNTFCQFSTYSLSIHNLHPLTTDIQCDAGHPGICYLGEPWKESVSSEGASISWKEIGIELHIPPGAIPEGETLELRVRPCLSGPFVPPEGYDLACPVYHISPAFHFLCDVKLSISHFCNLTNEKQCESMAFLSSPSRPMFKRHSPQYKFKVLSKGRFEPSLVYGSVSLSHFCLTAVGVKRKRADEEQPPEDDMSTPASKRFESTFLYIMILSTHWQSVLYFFY